MATKFELLEIEGREVKVTNPDKVYWAEPGHTKLDLVRYYLAVAEGALRGAGGRPMALKRFVDGAAGEFFFQKRAPDKRPEWIDTVSLSFPSGRTAEEVVLRDSASLAWVANLGCLDLNPHPVRARGSRPSRRAARRSRPGAGRALGGHPHRGAGGAGGARSGRARGLAQDLWLAGHPHQHPHRGALDVSRGATGRARPRPRRGSARPEAGHEQVVEGGAPRGLPRLQPERQGPNRGLRLLGATDSRCPRFDAADLGRGAPASKPRTSRSPPCRRLFAAQGDRHEGIDEAVGSLEALLELSARHEAEGLGDAPWPPHYRKQAGEPPRVQPSKRKPVEASPSGRRQSTKPLIEIARAARKDDASLASNAGRRVTRRRPRSSSRPTCWWTRCAAAPRRGRASASTSSTCRTAERPAQEPLDPDYDPWSGYRDGRPSAE